MLTWLFDFTRSIDSTHRTFPGEGEFVSVILDRTDMALFTEWNYIESVFSGITKIVMVLFCLRSAVRALQSPGWRQYFSND